MKEKWLDSEIAKIKDRNDIQLWEKIKQLGVNPNDVGTFIYDLVEKYPCDDWDAKRMALATQLTEIATKIQINDVMYSSDINELQENINDFFRKRSDKLEANSLEMISTLPPKRYILKSFIEYSKATLGLSAGFHLFGAEENVGKTAILIQLSVDILFNNPKSRVWYITLDDTGKKLSKRFLASLTYYLGDMKIHNASKINFANSYYDGWDSTHSDAMYSRKLRAMDTLKGYIRDKRLMIIGGEHSGESIKNELLECDPENDMLIIDAVYNLEINGTKNNGDNTLDGKRAKTVKGLSNYFGIPVVCTKQARKGKTKGSSVDEKGEGVKVKLGVEDLEGSGKWKHEPDTIAMMWVEKEVEEICHQKTERKFTVTSVAKNKTSDFRPVIRYLFNGAKNTFQELSEAKE